MLDVVVKCLRDSRPGSSRAVRARFGLRWLARIAQPLWKQQPGVILLVLWIGSRGGHGWALGLLLHVPRTFLHTRPQLIRIEHDRHRSIVDQVDCHLRSEYPCTGSQAELPE